MFAASSVITVTMAAHDLFVVALAACGWFVVAYTLMRRNPAAGDVAIFGAVLVTLGGLCRAFWTLLAATMNWQIAWLGNVLFPLLSAGFICLAWALWRGLRGKLAVGDADAAWTWGAPIVLSVGALGLAAVCETRYAGRGWFWTLLAMATVMNFLAIAQLVGRALIWKLPVAAVAFALHLVTVFTLAGLSDQSGTAQFLKQIINTLSQGAFMVAAILLQRRSSAET
jgi:hypothetical protein